MSSCGEYHYFIMNLFARDKMLNFLKNFFTKKKEAPDSGQFQKMSREEVRRLVATKARGNISLLMGRYVTEDDMERLHQDVSKKLPLSN